MGLFKKTNPFLDRKHGVAQVVAAIQIRWKVVSSSPSAANIFTSSSLLSWAIAQAANDGWAKAHEATREPRDRSEGILFNI